MNLAKLSINRRVAIYLVSITVAVLGILSLPGLPISFWPEFTAPTLIVVTSYPGVGPLEIEETIAKVLEEEYSSLEGVEDIETFCFEGLCRINIRFKWGYDFKEAKQNTLEKTNKARPRLPRDAFDPIVLQVQDFIPPGIELAFYSDKRSLAEVKDYVEKYFKNKFLRLENVASVQLFGGDEKEASIELNPKKMISFNITLGEVQQVLAGENFNLPAGKFESDLKNYNIRATGKFKDISDIENIVVANKKGVPILLKEIARVGFIKKEKREIARLNQREIIGVSIREKSGGNTVAMVDEVMDELKRIEKYKPEDIKVEIIRDQSEFIRKSIKAVVSNATIGAALAGLMIILFLGNLRNSLIIFLSIPLSVIGSFVLIKQFGLSINTISLGGLALGVGMIVDASIVVLENAFRILKEKKYSDKKEALVESTNEVQSAVISSTLTSIVVFLPMAFLSGLFAVLLGELALTIVFALSLSVIVSLTVVPLLCFKLMNIDSKGYLSFVFNLWNKFLERLTLAYKYSLEFSLKHRFLSLSAIVLVVVFFSIIFARSLDVEMLPSIAENEFQIGLTMPAGTKLERTDIEIKKLEDYLLKEKRIEKIYAIVGRTLTIQDLKSNEGYIIVRMKKEYSKEMDALIEQIRNDNSNIVGANLIVEKITATQGIQTDPINVRIEGENLEVLRQYGSLLYEKIKKIPGAVNLKTSANEALPEFQIQINREAASRYGINYSSLAQTAKAAFDGIRLSRLSSFGKEYDIVLRFDKNEFNKYEDLLNLQVSNMRGERYDLRMFANVVFEEGPTEIKRFDQIRAIEIKGGVSERQTKEVRSDIEKILSEIRLPEGYNFKLGGENRSIAESFRTLTIALLISIFLVYVTMASQFNSFIQPFVIAMTLPLSIVGALGGLYLFKASFSINAFLGLIMLAGVVVNNGILLIDFINQRREKGIDLRTAIVEGSVLRLRPILMTALTTVMGMFPIALGLGEGGEALKPLGAVAFGGLLSSTFLTLIVVPAVYSFFVGLKKDS